MSTIIEKKARRVQPPSHTDSPVVSDDDGIDINFSPSNGTPSKVPVERLSESEGPSSGDESDSSSDGEMNPVGDVPMRWYDGYDHIGYDRSGEKILPQRRPTALDLAADRSAWRKVYDEKNDEVIELSHEELKTIARMRAGRYPTVDADTTDEVVAWSGPVIDHPLTSGNEPKRRFLPSHHEARLVVKLVRAMREGKIPRPSEEAIRDNTEKDYQYDIWESHDPKTHEEMTKSERARDIMRVPAPKPPLPTNRESYNPPEEYLLSEKEAKRWEKADTEDRKLPYLPTKHSSLRHVPNYDNFIKERFERCLDLYLAVRMVKDQNKVDPDELVPDLPSPRDLRPFPTDIVQTFGPLPSRARCIDAHPNGQWLLSGSDDGCVRLWDIATGYNRATWNLGDIVDRIDDVISPVSAVSWCPKERAFVFAATVGKTLVIVGAASVMGVNAEETEAAMKDQTVDAVDEKVLESMKEAGIEWADRNMFKSALNGTAKPSGAEDAQTDAAHSESDIDDDNDNGGNVKESAEKKSAIITISHPRALRTFCWHRKGDYVACVGRDSQGGTIAIHRLSQRVTQLPFKKKTSLVQAVKFHPTRPFFLVATMQHVRVYNLAVQELVKTLKPGASWISSIDVHPGGDHVLVTSYDKRLCWFDLDLSTKPYKTIRNHSKAVRVAKYHPRLPLFADSSDDGSCHVFHGTVYDDLNKNALIVPLKKLEGCSTINDALGVLDICWHPRLPWLFTAGSDGAIHVIADCSQD